MTSAERYTHRVENSCESYEGLQHSLFSLKLRTSDNQSGDKVYVTVDDAAGDEVGEMLETDLDTRMESLCLSVTEHALNSEN